MITLAAARRIIAESVSPRPAVEVDLAVAAGCVLAQSVVADAFYPSGDLAMMDGYVVREDAQPGEFRIVGEIQPGAASDQTLGSGEAMRIFTGALVPKEGGRVIMQEDARRTGDLVEVKTFADRRFIRPKGAEAQPGRTVLQAGTRLTAVELAILAQVGAIRPSVFQPVEVLHVATGRELIPPEESPQPGQIRDTNSTLLAALFAAHGGCTFSSLRCGDDLDGLVELAKGPCDLLVISGGAGAGDYDFGAAALQKLGFTIHFNRVNLRPGKPLTFATNKRQAAFVVPGNPVSHFVCYHLALRLAMDRMLGLDGCLPFFRVALKSCELLRPDPRETYWPATVRVEAGRLVAEPKRWSTSGDTFSLAGTNALIRLAAGSLEDGEGDVLLLAPPAAATFD